MSSYLLRRSNGVSAISYAIITLFLLSIFLLGLANEYNLVPRLHMPDFTGRKKDKYDFPDFDRVIHNVSLSESEFGLDDPERRVVIIGDVHGMNRSLHNLLDELSYTPESDTLVFAGDVLAKSSHEGSLAVLDFLASHRPGSGTPGCVYQVRGNHDQMVLQWRAWRDWFMELKSPLSDPFTASSVTSTADIVDAGPPVHTGREFLHLIEGEYRYALHHDPKGAADPDEWADVARKRAAGSWRAEWWRRIPHPGKGRTEKDWLIFSDHYWLARDLTQAQAEYLYSLPLVLHVPSVHLFVVHAGLLPSDPKRRPTDARQPLAHTPDINAPEPEPELPDELYGRLDADDVLATYTGQDVLLHRAGISAYEDLLRTAQENALLSDIPDNRDAWVLLNMRGVRKKGKVTRSNSKGRPWSDLWNEQIGRCSGFSNTTAADADSRARSRIMASEDLEDPDVQAPLSCLPSTVVYGHAATRGLDVKRWSMGVDTGCLYGRKLSGLVLQQSNDDEEDEDEEEEEDEDEEDEDEEFDTEDDEDENEDDTVRLRRRLVRFATRARSSADSVEAVQKKRKSWRKRITFGDQDAGIRAQIVSIKCPKTGDLA